MRRRLIIILGTFVLLTIIASAIIYRLAPETSSVQTQEIEVAECLRDSSSNCIVLPSFTGVNLDNEEVAFPNILTEDFVLVAIPFGREHQAVIRTWLPLFQDLSEADEAVTYYSIAPMEDMNSGLRFIIINAMSSGTRDPLLRTQTILTFLEDLPIFLTSLALDNIDIAQIYIIDKEGTVYWQASGEYTEEAGLELQETLATLNQQ